MRGKVGLHRFLNLFMKINMSILLIQLAHYGLIGVPISLNCNVIAIERKIIVIKFHIT